MTSRELQSNLPAVGLGFLFAFGSSAGQTFFVSLFSGGLREELGLTHTGFGASYSFATIVSAFLLLATGHIADRYRISWLGAATFAALALSSLTMANVTSLLGLTVVFIALRFCGQGMLSHLAFTAMGRWFQRSRGRAVSLASLGYAAGQALLPGLVAAGLLIAGWRDIWVVIAAALFAILVPASILLGRHVRTPEDEHTEAKSTRMERDSWTRSRVLRDPRFYALLPGILAMPFIGTGVLFHQVYLVETKGWSLAAFAASYPLYAIASTVTGLGLGALIDRVGAARTLPFYLLPLACGLLLLGLSDSVAVAPAFMLLIGCTSGGGSVVLGALWPELYGTKHLGAIRALVTTIIVLATALSPGLMGLAIDAGVAFDTQVLAMAAYVLVAAGGFALQQRQLVRAPLPQSEALAS
ncbi:MAG: MFS transporter [Myxococcota bacterium]